MAALASNVEGETNSGPLPILLIPAITACRYEFFSKSTVAHTKMGHVSKTTPLLGVICHPFGKIYSPFVQNLRALASAIPDMYGAPKI